jgi:hypothetical protein
MAIRTELTLRLQNSPGALATVCLLFRAASVNLLAMCLESNGTLRLVTDNHVHAEGVLREHSYSPERREVLYVQLPNAPGAVAALGRLIASAGINVDYAYASVVEGEPMAAMVIGVADAQRAAAAAGM